jgi:hypothetical protein
MKKITITTLISFIGIILLVMSNYSCTNSSLRDFNNLIVELANEDATIDHSDWVKITKYIEDNKRQMEQFYDDDKIDVKAVKDYITDFFANRRPPKEITFSGIGGKEFLTVKFYLERSGSMTPYDSRSGAGEFKSAIVSMLNNLPGNNSDNHIYVVNSGVYDYPKGFSSFINDPDIFAATKGIGDPSYTDFSKIFDNILNKTGEDELSILVTDMIYSTKNMAGVNSEKIFSDAQGMINSVFKSSVKNRSMLIVKMRGSFNGEYYPYNSPTSGKSYSGARPFYIVIVGSNENIARLSTDVKYSDFDKFSSLRGFEHQYLFETSDVYKPYYSLLLSGGEVKGRFEPEHGQGNQITSVKNIEPDAKSGKIQMAIAVNLNNMFIDDDYLLNPSNYKITSEDNVTIKEIRPINKGDYTPYEKNFLSKATHLIILSMPNVSHKQTVEIKLLNNLPQWIEQSSSDDDTNLSAPNFSESTFGLKYLLQGIYNSYKNNTDDAQPYYFNLKLNLSD